MIRVNEAFKQCEWQEVFDVMLAAVVHNVFETDQMESALPANGHKVHLTMSWGEQFGSIRLAYGGFALLQVCPPPVRPHYGERTTSNGAKLPDSACSEENDYLPLGLQCFAIEYESYSLFFFLLFSCALVPEGTCTTWEAPSKGSVPRQIASCERYMRVQKTTLR